MTVGQLDAQRTYYRAERSNDGNVLLFNALYGVHWPGGDLADRFGSHFSAGGTVEFLTKSNFIVGAHSNFYFGTNVNTDVLAPLRDEDDLLFGDDGGIAEVRLRQRGLYVGGHVGKIFPIFGPNKRSGIRVTVGGGYLQHKIRIQDDPQVFVSTLNSNYKKGYDRFTNGFALTEFIGYQYLATNRMVNFLIGLELTQGFTQNRRSFNFDTRSAETDGRLDLLAGLRIGWTLPLYVGENAAEIRY